MQTVRRCLQQFSKIASVVQAGAPSSSGTSTASRSLFAASGLLTFDSSASTLLKRGPYSPAGQLQHLKKFSTDIEDDDLGDSWPYYGYDVPPAFVGRPAPQFKAKAVVDGEFKDISLADYKGKYVVLFFYPKDFTFVCPTEIIAFSDRAKDFEAINCQLIAASTDTEETHLAWIKTPRKKGGLGHMQIPILADTTKAVSARYGCLVPEAGIALRGLYIINPEGILEQIIVNNMPIGRSVDEVLRLVQAIQFVKEHGEVCPADWKPGAATMIADADKSLDYFSQQDETAEEFGSALPSVDSPKHFTDLVKSTDKLVVDFMAPWCGKCKMIAPFVDELVEKYPGVKFVKFDTTADALDSLSSELGVKGLPTFKFYRNGSEVHPDVVGYKKKPLEDAVSQL